MRIALGGEHPSSGVGMPRGVGAGSDLRRTSLVSTNVAAYRINSSPTSARNLAGACRLGALDVLLLSAWCGLAGGLLEVGTTICVRNLIPTNRGYLMTRHFVWLAPLSNLLLFSAMGLLLAAVAWLWPRRGGRLGTRLIGLLAVLPCSW